MGEIRRTDQPNHDGGRIKNNFKLQITFVLQKKMDMHFFFNLLSGIKH